MLKNFFDIVSVKSVSNLSVTPLIKPTPTSAFVSLFSFDFKSAVGLIVVDSCPSPFALITYTHNYI